MEPTTLTLSTAPEAASASKIEKDLVSPKRLPVELLRSGKWIGNIVKTDAWAYVFSGTAASPGLILNEPETPYMSYGMFVGGALVQGNDEALFAEIHPRFPIATTMYRYATGLESGTEGFLIRSSVDVPSVHLNFAQALFKTLQQAGENNAYVAEATLRVRKDNSVDQFLSLNPELVAALPEALKQIQHHYGRKADVELRVVIDPEVIGLEKLYAYIITPMELNEAIDHLEQIDDQWYLNQSAEIRRLFNFNLKPQ
jgi:hypothetical protein